MDVGDTVAWIWTSGIAEGTVVEVHYRRTEITSKGKRIARNGTADNPAVVINHKSGNLVLKLQSEIQKTS